MESLPLPQICQVRICILTSSPCESWAHGSLRSTGLDQHFFFSVFLLFLTYFHYLFMYFFLSSIFYTVSGFGSLGSGLALLKKEDIEQSSREEPLYPRNVPEDSLSIMSSTQAPLPSGKPVLTTPRSGHPLLQFSVLF